MDPKANIIDAERLKVQKNAYIICEPYEAMRSDGRLIRTEQSFPFPVVILQIALVNLMSAIFELLLKPFGQLTFVAQMLAGIAVGPSFLGYNEAFTKKVFTPLATAAVIICHFIGIIFSTFLLSVQIDISVVKRSGRLAFVIGIGSFFLPVIVAMSLSCLLKDVLPLNEDIYRTIPVIFSLEATTSVHVVITLLTDLKLLNSEIGRLALSSSMISTIINWIALSTAIYMNTDEKAVEQAAYKGELSLLSMILVIVFALRPIMIWMMRQTPQGKHLSKHHLMAVILMVFFSVFFGEMGGMHCYLGPIILGIATPVSPPLGSCLMDKLGSFVWGVLLPCFLIDIGKNMDLFAIQLGDFLVLELLLLVTILVRVFLITISSLYFKMPLMDALLLALIMNIQGIFDIQGFGVATNVELITLEGFRIMTIIAMMHSSMLTMLVRVFHDSSRRYVSYKTHTIQHSTRSGETRILACIHEKDNASGVINILEASNSQTSHIGVYILNLEVLVGRTMPQLIPNQIDKSESSTKPTKYDPMINALRQFQQRNVGLTWLQCFTAIAPIDSMHEDICSMALDKSVALVIFPLQKSDKVFIRTIVKNLVEMCPCSVGFLINRGIFMDPKPIFSSKMTINVCVVFVGGADDWEALAYGARMAGHTNVMLTVVRLIALQHTCSNTVHSIEVDHDLNMIKDFKSSTKDNKNVDYVERHVTEGPETAHVLNSLNNDFDLILVGRSHDIESPIFTGLVEWNEIEELGVVADVLICSELLCKASVLVIQQQVAVAEKVMVESPRHISVKIQ